MKNKTLFDKVWDSHVVTNVPNGPQVLYIDKHLIHEVTSPQAFAELEDRGIPVFRPNQIQPGIQSKPAIGDSQPPKNMMTASMETNHILAYSAK